MVRRTAIIVSMVLALSATSWAARYKGERIDVNTGDPDGRWIIRTRQLAGQDVLRTIVRCKPAAKCRPFPVRLRLDLTPGADVYYWDGSFDVGGVPCGLSTYVYDDGFEGTYRCDDGQQGAISGRRVVPNPGNPGYPYVAH